MRKTDLDGKGMWEYSAILARYRALCRNMKIHPRSIAPNPADYTTQRGWISPVMDEIFKGMRNGDLACACIAIDLIEEDGGFAFGSIMKARAARELKRMRLNEEQKQRIRRRVLDMLQRKFMPHEFRFYVRLVARIKAGDLADEFHALRKDENPWVRFFAHIALGENPGPKPGRDWRLQKSFRF